MKNHLMITALAAAVFCFAPSLAAAIDAQAVTTAKFQSVPLKKPMQMPPEPDAAIVKLQVLLDRAGVSPGVIDGYFGDNLIKAVAGFEAQQKLAVDGTLDQEVLARLTDAVPAVQAYAITAEDGQNLVSSIPQDYAKQAELPQLGYTSIAEKLAERFHMDINPLKSFNPTASFAPGETIAVTIAGNPKSGVVKGIEVNRTSGQVVALAEDGSLVSVYPATIGSEDPPSPTGIHEVTGVSRCPSTPTIRRSISSRVTTRKFSSYPVVQIGRLEVFGLILPNQPTASMVRRIRN